MGTNEIALERDDLRDRALVYKDRVKKFKHAIDLRAMADHMDVINGFEKFIIDMISRNKSSILFDSRYKYILNTYMCIDTIPLWEKIITIATVYSDISVLIGDYDILGESYDPIMNVNQYVDIDAIQLVTYENLLNAMETYNTYMNTNYEVDNIIRPNEALIANKFTSYYIDSETLPPFAAATCTSGRALYVMGKFIIDGYVFADDVSEFNKATRSNYPVQDIIIFQANINGDVRLEAYTGLLGTIILQEYDAESEAPITQVYQSKEDFIQRVLRPLRYQIIVDSSDLFWDKSFWDFELDTDIEFDNLVESYHYYGRDGGYTIEIRRDNFRYYMVEVTSKGRRRDLTSIIYESDIPRRDLKVGADFIHGDF